jgi:hypothetical protein
LVAQFQYNKSDDTYTCPKENQKTTGRWHKKSGRTEQSYQFKNTEPSLQNVRKTHLCTRPAGREIDRTSTRKALKKITNAIKKTRNYTERDKINEHIFGTIKDNGVTITLI